MHMEQLISSAYSFIYLSWWNQETEHIFRLSSYIEKYSKKFLIFKLENSINNMIDLFILK